MSHTLLYLLFALLATATVMAAPSAQSESSPAIGSAAKPAIGSACQNTRLIKEGDTCYFIATEICKTDLNTLYLNNGSLENGSKCDNLKIGDPLCCKY